MILYTAADGKVTADVFFVQEIFWLTQRTMAELFGVNAPAISKHLKNIYESQELSQGATVAKMETVQIEGGRQVSREVEVSKLDRLVTMFIDFAELRALDRQVMTMKDWLHQVEKFLNYTDQQILRHAGQISHGMAIAKASEEYEKYRVHQNREYLSDFDHAFAKYLQGSKEL